ncbi:MAG: biotin--[acetyl-CoA-carboxylase] ligase, partial [Paracoccaceae bacterium]
EMGFSKIREIWMKRAANVGKEILARTPSSEYRGVFDSIDEKGQLVLTNNIGQTKIAAAEIFFSNG